jgi:hypothetical protein
VLSNWEVQFDHVHSILSEHSSCNLDLSADAQEICRSGDWYLDAQYFVTFASVLQRRWNVSEVQTRNSIWNINLISSQIEVN